MEDKKITLYEYATDLRIALESIELDEDGCVINPEVLDEVEANFEKKAEAVACMVKEMRAFASTLKAQKDSFAERYEAEVKRADGLERYLSKMMLSVEKKSLKTTLCEIKFRKSVVLRHR